MAIARVRARVRARVMARVMARVKAISRVMARVMARVLARVMARGSRTYVWHARSRRGSFLASSHVQPVGMWLR